MNKKKIPEAIISRMFMYLREISYLSDMKIRTISSSELGERLNLSDSQVRKDLGYFGNFGVTGSGYDIAELKKALEKILSKDKTHNVAVVGVGHLGTALLYYSGFLKLGLNIIAAFDKNDKKIGKCINNIVVESSDEIYKTITARKISIAIIAVPPQEAELVAGELVKAGVECIMNFAPINLNFTDNIKIKNVDLSRELETLSYFANSSKQT